MVLPGWGMSVGVRQGWLRSPDRHVLRASTSLLLSSSWAFSSLWPRRLC
jgi:hypothetical protein